MREDKAFGKKGDIVEIGMFLTYRKTLMTLVGAEVKNLSAFQRVFHPIYPLKARIRRDDHDLIVLVCVDLKLILLKVVTPHFGKGLGEMDAGGA